MLGDTTITNKIGTPTCHQNIKNAQDHPTTGQALPTIARGRPMTDRVLLMTDRVLPATDQDRLMTGPDLPMIDQVRLTTAFDYRFGAGKSGNS